jgi:nucleotide-binding universal stress UspA family protein
MIREAGSQRADRPHRIPPVMYKHLLVPLDGSDTSKGGLREAIALATPLNAKLHLVHVISDFPMMVDIDFEKVRSDLQHRGRDLLETAAAEVRAVGLGVSTELRDSKGGRVAEAIVQAARDAACDLIVIGTHGRRGFNRALMGSDAERVLRESSVPVLLVRAAGAVS